MPYIQPSRSDVHVNGPLTNISIAYIQTEDKFVAASVFPNIAVPKQSDLYFTYDRGEFNRDEMTARTPGTESSGGSYEIDTASYLAVTRAHHKDVPDQVRANQDSPINLDREATIFLSTKAMINREVNWVTKYFATGIWTTSTTPANLWDTDTGTPIEDVRLGRRTVLESTGFMPNVMVLGRAVYDALLDHPDIIGRINAGQTPNGPAIAMRTTLAALFELDEILVMDAIQNTAEEGQTPVHSFIGGKNALLVYRTPTPGIMTPSGGYTFSWTGLLGSGAMGGRISKFRMESLKSDRVEIEMSYDQKLVAADLGYMFISVVS